MAAMPMYGKNSSKIFFSRTGGPISTKLGTRFQEFVPMRPFFEQNMAESKDRYNMGGRITVTYFQWACFCYPNASQYL